MNFMESGNGVGISNEALYELEIAVDRARPLTTSCNSSQSAEDLNEISASMEHERVKSNAYLVKDTEDRFLRNQETLKTSLDMDEKQMPERKALETVRDQKKDLRELKIIQGLKLHELNELKQTFGDGIKEVAYNILQNYEEEFKFKIIQLLDNGDNWRMQIHFIRNGVAQRQFPIVLTINTKTIQVVDVETNLYAADKLLLWLQRNNGNAPLLIRNLGKMLDDLLNKYGNSLDK